MPRRRTRIAALENAARLLVGRAQLVPQRSPMTVAIGPAVEHDMALPLRVMKSVRIGAAVERDFAGPIRPARGRAAGRSPRASATVTRGGARSGGRSPGEVIGRGRRGIRVRLTPRHAVAVKTWELTTLAGGAVGGFGSPLDGRGAAIGSLIGFAVGLLWEAYGPGSD